MATFSDLKSYVSTNNLSSNPSNNSSGKSSSSTPTVAPTGPLSNGGSMDLKDFASQLNQMGIATPNYSQTTGLNSAGQAVLTAANLGQYAGMPATVPAVKSPYTEGVVTSGMTGLALNTPSNISTPTETSTTSSATDLFNQYITAQKENQMPSMAAEYAKAEKAAQIAQKQQAVNDYTAQLNTIAARQQSDLLSLRGTGAREGVTEAVYGGQQATINREAAIAALPVQAQLAAAQGNLQMAQERLDTLFKLKMEDAKNQYEFTNNVIDKYYQFASQEQKAALDEKKSLQARAYDVEDRNISLAQDWSTKALSTGQASLAASIGKLDPKSDSFREDLARLTGQISVGGGTEAPKVVDINGVDSIWDGSKFVPASSTGTKSNELSLAQSQANIKNITDLTTSGGMSTAVGTNILSRSPSGFWGALGKVATVIGLPGLFKDAWKSATGQTQDFIAGVEQLSSTLSLDSLIQAKAKGATFGALSDSELRVLSSSASKLGSWIKRDDTGNPTGYNTTESNFKKELDRINNFAKLDYLLKGGAPEDVNVTIQPDGSYWTVNSDGTYSQLR